MNIQATAHLDLHRIGCVLQIDRMQQVRKYCATRDGHPSGKPLCCKPRKGLIHTGAQLLGYGLQVILTKGQCVCSEA